MTFIILNKDEKIVTTLSQDVVSTDSAPILSAILTDKLNSIDELSFSTIADSTEAQNIIEDNYVVIDDNGVIREFIIDEVIDEDSAVPIKTVTASSSEVELKDKIVEKEISENSPERCLSMILSGSRCQVGTVESGIRNRKFATEVLHKTALEAVFLLQEFYNCDIHFSYVHEKGRIVKRQVNLYSRLGQDIGKRFEVGKDVKEVKRTVDTSSIKTAIIPLGKSKEETDKTFDIASVEWKKSKGDPVDKPKGQTFLSDPNALLAWGRRDENGKLMNRFTFVEMEIETPEELATMAWVQLGKYTKPKVTYESKVIDLYRLTGDTDYSHEYVRVGDNAAVIDFNFTVPMVSKERIVEIKRDLLSADNDEVVLGESKGSYSSDIGRLDSIQSDADKAISNSNNALESANGKNNNYYGSVPPDESKLIEGDMWYKPNQNDPTEIIQLIWDGTQWIEVSYDYSKIEEELDKHKEDIDQALSNADKAIEEAGFSKNLAEKAKQEAEKAFKEAESQGGKLSKLSLDFEEEKNKLTVIQTDVEDGKVNIHKLESDAESSKETISNIDGKVTSVEKNVNGIQQAVEDKVDKSEHTQLAGLVQTTIKDSGVPNLVTNSGVVGKNTESWTFPKAWYPSASQINGNVRWGINIKETGVGLNRLSSEAVPIDSSKKISVSYDYSIASMLESNAMLYVGVQFLDKDLKSVGFVENKHNTITGTEYVEDKMDGVEPPGTAKYARFSATLDHAANAYVGKPMMTVTDEAVSYKPNGTSQSQITQTKEMIDLRVEKAGVISAVNVSPEGILLLGKKIMLDGDVTMNTAFINNLTVNSAFVKSIKAIDIDAARITTGFMNANRIKAGMLTGNNAEFNLETGKITTFGDLYKNTLRNGAFQIDDVKRNRKMGYFGGIVDTDGKPNRLVIGANYGYDIGLGFAPNGESTYKAVATINNAQKSLDVSKIRPNNVGSTNTSLNLSYGIMSGYHGVFLHGHEGKGGLHISNGGKVHFNYNGGWHLLKP